MVFSGSQSSLRSSRPSQRGFWVKKHRQLETEHVILWGGNAAFWLVGEIIGRSVFSLSSISGQKVLESSSLQEIKPLPALGKMCLLSPPHKEKSVNRYLSFASFFISSPPFCFVFLTLTNKIKNKIKKPLEMWHSATKCSEPETDDMVLCVEKKCFSVHFCLFFLGHFLIVKRPPEVSGLSSLETQNEFLFDARPPDSITPSITAGSRIVQLQTMHPYTPPDLISGLPQICIFLLTTFLRRK